MPPIPFEYGEFFRYMSGGRAPYPEPEARVDVYTADFAALKRAAKFGRSDEPANLPREDFFKHQAYRAMRFADDDPLVAANRRLMPHGLFLAVRTAETREQQQRHNAAGWLFVVTPKERIDDFGNTVMVGDHFSFMRNRGATPIGLHRTQYLPTVPGHGWSPRPQFRRLPAEFELGGAQRFAREQLRLPDLQRRPQATQAAQATQATQATQAAQAQAQAQATQATRAAQATLADPDAFFRAWAPALRDLLAMPWERPGGAWAGSSAAAAAAAEQVGGAGGRRRQRRRRRAADEMRWRASDEEAPIASFGDLWARLPIRRVTAVTLPPAAAGGPRPVTVFVEGRFDGTPAMAGRGRACFHGAAPAPQPQAPAAAAAGEGDATVRAAVLRAMRRAVSGAFLPPSAEELEWERAHAAELAAM